MDTKPDREKDNINHTENFDNLADGSNLDIDYEYELEKKHQDMTVSIIGKTPILI